MLSSGKFTTSKVSMVSGAFRSFSFNQSMVLFTLISHVFGFNSPRELTRRSNKITIILNREQSSAIGMRPDIMEIINSYSVDSVDDLNFIIQKLNEKRDHLISLNPPEPPEFLKGKVLSCTQNEIVWSDKSITECNVYANTHWGRTGLWFEGRLQIGPFYAEVYTPDPDDCSRADGFEELYQEWKENYYIESRPQVKKVILWWFQNYAEDKLKNGGDGHEGISSAMGDLLENALGKFDDGSEE
jgi:hypothetical protein